MSDTRERSSPNVVYYVRGLAMGIPAYLFGIHLWTWVIFLPGAMQGHADFRQLYAAGAMVRTGHSHQLYEYTSQKLFQDTLVSPEQIALPFIRPAYQALLFAPLSVLSYRTAYFVFLAINLVLLGICYRLLRLG